MELRNPDAGMQGEAEHMLFLHVNCPVKWR